MAKLTVHLELTPLGKALVRLAETIIDSEFAMPPDVAAAARDVVAIGREFTPDMSERD